MSTPIDRRIVAHAIVALCMATEADHLCFYEAEGSNCLFVVICRTRSWFGIAGAWKASVFYHIVLIMVEKVTDKNIKIISLTNKITDSTTAVLSEAWAKFCA